MAVNFARIKPLFWSHHVYADHEGYQDATIVQYFNVPLLKKAADYLVTVERLEISTNGIPYMEGMKEGNLLVANAKENQVVQLVRHVGGAFVAGVFVLIIGLKRTYSLVDTVRSLQQSFDEHETFDAAHNPVPSPFNKISVRLAGTGHILISTKEHILNPLLVPPLGGGPIPPQDDVFLEWELILPNRLTEAFDIGIARSDGNGRITAAVAGLPGAFQFGRIYTSTSPRFDAGDRLMDIILTTNLPTISDNVGQTKTNILTDFSFRTGNGAASVPNIHLSNGIGTQITEYRVNGEPVDFMSHPRDVTNIGYSTRQKIFFTPKQRRWIQMISDAPINHIRISARYRDTKGNDYPIQLPPGCMFSIKLGFYLK